MKYIKLIERIARVTKDNKKLIKGMGLVLSGIGVIYVIGFLIKLVKDNDINYISSKSLFLMLLFSIISSLIAYVNAFIYNLILNKVRKTKIEYREVRNIYVMSNLYKYLPSNVMHYVARNIIATKYKFNQKKMTISTIVEVTVIISTAVIFSLSIYLALKQLLSILILFIIVLIYLLTRFRVTGIVILSVLVTTINNLVFVVIFNIYSGNRDILTNCFTISLYQTISWVVGFLTPGAPGGLGIKELVLIKISGTELSGIMAIVAVLHRIVLVSGDLLSVFILKLINIMGSDTNDIGE